MLPFYPRIRGLYTNKVFTHTGTPSRLRDQFPLLAPHENCRMPGSGVSSRAEQESWRKGRLGLGF